MGDTTQLEEVLADPEVEALDRIFRACDHRAAKAQARHMRYTRLFVVATAVASLAAAGLLIAAGGIDGLGRAWPGLAEALAGDAARTALTIVQIISLGLAALAGQMLEMQRHDMIWKDERQAAERARLDVFDRVISTAQTIGPKAHAAAFSHFVAAHLDGQIAYFAKAVARHERRSHLIAMLGGIGAVLTAIAGVSGVSGMLLALVAVAGIVAPVLMTAISAWRARTADDTKARRYRRVWTTLVRISGRVPAAKAALAEDDAGPATAIVAEVQSCLRAEVEGWHPVARKS